VWRRIDSVDARFGVLVFCAVLVNPHLFVYDAAVLALPILWLGGWIEEAKPPFRAAYWQAVYFLYFLTLIPTARIIILQGSVLLMCFMFFRTAAAIHAVSAERLQPRLLVDGSR
jgi:hypothetical protein